MKLQKDNLTQNDSPWNFRISSLPFYSRLLLTLGALMLGVFGTTSAQATSTGSATGSAFGESVNLTLLGNPIKNGPLPSVYGTAPPDFNKHAEVASATVSNPLLGLLLQTGVLTVNTNSNVETGNSVHADATVNDTSIALLSLLAIDATVLQSTVDISGTCGGNLTAVGKTTIVAGIVGGTIKTTSIPVNPAPNTVLLNLLGIRVVVNEQIKTGDGVNNRGLTVNAIHISFANVSLAGIGLVNGDIIVSQSKAQRTCPTPTADLVLTKSDSPDPVNVGAILTYTVTAKNNGPDAATNVVVTDTLPPGANFISAIPSQGTTCTGTSIVTCKLGSINTGNSANVTIKVTITKVINRAKVTAAQTDPNNGNNSASATTTLQ